MDSSRLVSDVSIESHEQDAKDENSEIDAGAYHDLIHLAAAGQRLGQRDPVGVFQIAAAWQPQR